MNIQIHPAERAGEYLELLLTLLAEANAGELVPDSDTERTI